METRNQPAARRPKPVACADHGIALVIVLLMMMLLSALGLSLTMVTSTEERVAEAYLNGSETFYAADAALQLAVEELNLVPDWNRVLDGSVSSTFIDGQVESRGWPGGVAETRGQATALVTCGRTECTPADMDTRTPDRPWGRNNPRWQLFAYGPVEDMSASGAVNSRIYVVVWVGDDQTDNDGDALVDGGEEGGPNPGRGVVALLVHAYGTSSRRAIEATVARAGSGIRVVSWRESR